MTIGSDGASYKNSQFHSRFKFTLWTYDLDSRFVKVANTSHVQAFVFVILERGDDS